MKFNNFGDSNEIHNFVFEGRIMPQLMVFAGPNGSGKSTITERIGTIGDYVNADLIAEYFHFSDQEAADNADMTREKLILFQRDFTFETVLSKQNKIDLMLRAKQQGYRETCIYVLTCDPEINVRRVERRAADGGHYVPPEKVKARYYRAMRLLPQLLSICDELYIFDNSPERDKGEPALIVSLRNGELKTYPSAIWSQEMIESLLKGVYQGREK